MKVQSITVFLAVVLLCITGIWAYVRFAPSDVACWNVDPTNAYEWPQDSWNEVIGLTDGAVLRIPAADELLARIDVVAMTTPRSIRLAGDAAEGRITWVTRSAIWGFPDYTTAQSTPDGVYIHARLRFGKSDLGVNAARLRDWLSKL